MNQSSSRIPGRVSTALLGACWAALCVCAPLGAQTLQITSPADGATAYSGQPLTITVSASGTFQAVGLFSEAPLPSSQMVTAPPYQFTIQVPPATSSRPYTFSASGVIAPGQSASSDPISINIERPDVPQQLNPQLSTISLHYIGDTAQETIYGTFADGSKIDLTYSSLLTYTSDTPTVATVDGNGRVTAVAPGWGNILQLTPACKSKSR